MAQRDGVTVPGGQAHGEGARCPGRSTRDILLADADGTPAVLLEESSRPLGDQPIPYSRYVDEAFARREQGAIWGRVWQWACRVEQVPEVGDYLVYDIGPHSVLVVHGPDGVHAFRNVCLHRGTQLRPPESSGHATRFRCPFHGWSYDLAGKLVDLPCAWDFPDLGAPGLEPVRCELWGGFVFINLDRDAGPLADHLAPLPQHFSGRWDLSRRGAYLHVVKELPSNWKACLEAFLEAYHVFETHAQYLAISSDANAQYDLYGDHVSRFINPTGVPSPHYPGTLSEQEILAQFMLPPGDAGLAPGETARSAAAAAFRTLLGAEWGVDLTGHSTSEMVDSIEYFLFPNACLFPGITLNMVYRFRPARDRVDRTCFEIMMLRPLPEDGSVWHAPEPILLGPDQPFTAAPGLATGLAEVFDQDVGNLAAQWNGFLAAGADGTQRLGRYQESRIRHFHAAIDKHLEAQAG